MNRSTTLPPKFWPIAVGTYLAALAVGAASVSPLITYAHNQAASYSRDAASQAQATTALLELRTAQVLDPNNAAYRQQLADRYITQGDLSQAVAVLGTSPSELARKASLLVQLGRYNDAVTAVQGVGGSAAAVVRSQAYLEEGRGVQAKETVQNQSGDSALIQLGLCEAATGNTGAVAALIPRADNPATQAELERMQGGGLALAQVLYAGGMYQTATRVLATVPDSSAKYVLLAHLWLSRKPATHQNLLTAQSAAQQGSRLDPANLSLHSLLHDIDSQLGDQAGAAAQQQLIDQLQSGKI